jgi:polyvinyl alcohol dehydrogenase (cytochrome)
VIRAIVLSVLVGIVASTPASADWPVYRHDLDNSGNAGVLRTWHKVHLQLRWTYVADSRITSTPTFARGIVYAGTWNGDVLALDQTTGTLRWKAHLGANPDEVYGGPRGVIASVAIAADAVVAASGNCTIAAYDARTGERRWRTKICDNSRSDDVYASPVVVRGLVLIGTDILADRPTSRGREIALDERSGAVRWTIEPAQYRGTGTGISATPAIDATTGIVFLGTGNPTPVQAPPPGDDPGSESILALDVMTGKKRWSFGPVHPHDLNDDDFFASPNRVDVGSRSRAQWIIGEGNKDGTYYAVDAASGKLLWRRALAPDTPSAMVVGTAAVGAGTIYVPLYHGESGSLTALRASDGVVLWQRTTGGEYEAPVVWGSAVFTTEATGWLDAFGGGDGKPLGRWRLCGRATGRGPAASDGGLYVAAGDCLAYFVATE